MEREVKTTNYRSNTNTSQSNRLPITSLLDTHKIIDIIDLMILNCSIQHNLFLYKVSLHAMIEISW